MRREPDFFGEDTDLPLIYVAKKLKEALRIEELLTEAGLDYLVEPDKYTHGIFRRQRIGAFFYVAPADDEPARALLMREGYWPHPPS